MSQNQSVLCQSPITSRTNREYYDHFEKGFLRKPIWQPYIFIARAGRAKYLLYNNKNKENP